MLSHATMFSGYAPSVRHEKRELQHKAGTKYYSRVHPWQFPGRLYTPSTNKAVSLEYGIRLNAFWAKATADLRFGSLLLPGCRARQLSQASLQ